MTTKRPREQGFTLIELLVTVAVMGILVAIAAPNFTTMILNQRADGLAEELSAALQLAKTEAVKRGGRVTLCAANEDGDACSADWTDGWLVIADSAATDGAGAPVLDSNADIIRYFHKPNDGSVITAINNGAVSFVRYTSTGQLARIGGRANVTPIVFDTYVERCQGDRRRTISVGVAGMMDIDRSACPGA